MIEGTTHKALVENTPTKYREHLQKALLTLMVLIILRTQKMKIIRTGGRYMNMVATPSKTRLMPRNRARFKRSQMQKRALMMEITQTT